MRIVVLPPRGVVFAEGSPWLSLIAGLQSAGHEVEGFGIGGGPYDALVAMNDQPLVGEVQTRYAMGQARTALIALEPRVTSPRMYTNRSLRRYGHRYAASPMWAAQIGGKPFAWPQEISPQQARRGDDTFAATMINGDKRSAVPGSLYGLRRSVIRESRDQRMRLAVFGPGWDASVQTRLASGVKAVARALISGTSPRLGEALGGLPYHPASWMGRVEDKSEAFATAPVAIVIENSADYVSEKLVDAIRGGVVPVYVGPPLSHFGFPDSIAIPAKSTAADVVRTVQSLARGQIDEVVSAGGAWLESADAQRHEIRTVLFGLGEMIGQRLATSSP